MAHDDRLIDLLTEIRDELREVNHKLSVQVGYACVTDHSLEDDYPEGFSFVSREDLRRARTAR